MSKLVFSYSHVDEDLRNKLEVHLSSLKRLKLIETWHDRRIIAGQEFGKEIGHFFDEADVILLLVSPDFIASDYCYQTEMARALDRHNRGEAVVIPVILRPCDWHALPFGKLLAGTVDGKPIVHFPTLDDGFLQVVQAIKQAIQRSAPGKPAQVTPIAVQAEQNNGATGDRSSNLRIKRTFTDRDRDQALLEGFDYIAHFFSNSLDELKGRNSGVDATFQRVDANSFEAAIYVGGKRQCQCGIWRGGLHGTGDVFYSGNGITRNSYNESLTLRGDGYTLGFEPMGMSFSGKSKDKQLSNQGAAEYLWGMLIERLQK